MNPLEWTAQQAVRPPPTYAATIYRPPKHPLGYSRTTVRVLELLERKRWSLSIAQISNRLDLHVTTVSNALCQLKRTNAIDPVEGPVAGNRRPVIRWSAAKWRS